MLDQWWRQLYRVHEAGVRLITVGDMDLICCFRDASCTLIPLSSGLAL